MQVKHLTDGCLKTNGMQHIDNFKLQKFINENIIINILRSILAYVQQMQFHFKTFCAHGGLVTFHWCGQIVRTT